MNHRGPQGLASPAAIQLAQTQAVNAQGLGQRSRQLARLIFEEILPPGEEAIALHERERHKGWQFFLDRMWEESKPEERKLEERKLEERKLAERVAERIVSRVNKAGLSF